MSDDLGPWPEKVYLLHPSIKSFGGMVTSPERREYVLADRIEELERERDEAMMTGHDLAKIEYRDLVGGLEAKLAKAVEALRLASKINKMPFNTAKAINAVLAELEGGEEAAGTAWRGRE